MKECSLVRVNSNIMCYHDNINDMFIIYLFTEYKDTKKNM